MRHLALVLAVALAVALGARTVLAAGDWPMGLHDAQLSGFNSDERIIGPRTFQRLRPAWVVPRVSVAVAAENRVYAVQAAATGSYHVGVLDAQTGTTVRSLSLAQLHLPANAIPGALALASGRLLVAGPHRLVAVNPAGGSFLWRAGEGASSLTVADNRVFTGESCQASMTICGHVASSSVDLRTGRVLWVHPGNNGAPPALIAGRLYQRWGAFSGSTSVYDPSSGSLVATLPLKAAWTGDASHVYAQVLSGKQPGAWLGRIGSTGKAIWRVALGTLYTGRPVLAYGTLFSTSNRPKQSVVAVDAATGHVRWSRVVGPDVQLLAENHLLLVFHTDAGQGTVSAFDTSTGTRVGRLAVPRYRGVAPVSFFVARGTLYVIDGSGLRAFRP